MVRAPVTAAKRALSLTTNGRAGGPPFKISYVRGFSKEDLVYTKR